MASVAEKLWLRGNSKRVERAVDYKLYEGRQLQEAMGELLLLPDTGICRQDLPAYDWVGWLALRLRLKQTVVHLTQSPLLNRNDESPKRASFTSLALVRWVFTESDK